MSRTAFAHSLPTDRKTSRTALLFLRSFLSTAFLALFLSRGSQPAIGNSFDRLAVRVLPTPQPTSCCHQIRPPQPTPVHYSETQPCARQLRLEAAMLYSRLLLLLRHTQTRVGEAPRRAPDLPAPGTAIKICSACHGPGHWARECPAEGRAGRSGEPWHSNTVPPDPCWACPGEYHWAHQCEKSLARRAAGQFVLCGKDDHWFKKCELYNPAIHRSKQKNPGRPGTGPQRSNATWCLRHGQTGHSNAMCDISSAPILLPPEELKEQFETSACGAICAVTQ